MCYLDRGRYQIYEGHEYFGVSEGLHPDLPEERPKGQIHSALVIGTSLYRYSIEPHSRLTLMIHIFYYPSFPYNFIRCKKVIIRKPHPQSRGNLLQTLIYSFVY